MTGQVLEYSAQTDAGLIEGDDGNRYSFTGDAWQIPGAPRAGMRIDFQPHGSDATVIYTAAPTTRAAVALDTGSPGLGSPISTLGIFGMCVALLAVVLFQKAYILGFPLMLAGFALSTAGLVIGRKRGQRVGFAVAGIALSCIPAVVNIIIGLTLGAAFGNTDKAIVSQLFPFT